jgi:hypothetical protein
MEAVILLPWSTKKRAKASAEVKSHMEKTTWEKDNKELR